MPPIHATTEAFSAPVPPLGAADRQVLLGKLRRKLERIERGHAPPRAGARVGFAVPAVDRALPGGGLDPAALHEVVATEADGAALAFTAALAARRAGDTGVVLWCTARPGLYAPGLAAFGLSPDRLLLARGRDDQARLWAMEEGLRCPALTAVVGEVRTLDLTQSRRLQLAAETGGVMALLLRPAGAALGAGAAATRWQVTAAPAVAPEAYLGVGPPRLRADLLRARGADPRTWFLDWTGHGFALAGGGVADEEDADKYDQQSDCPGRPAGAGAVAALVAGRPAAA